jgi:hypothetical protein
MSERYRWRPRPVPGARIRRVAWWLKEFRWPWERTISSRSLRYRTFSWLAGITDDRAWTVKHQTAAQRWWRKRLGLPEREYVLEDTEAPRG